jgi:hypothetical protein
MGWPDLCSLNGRGSRAFENGYGPNMPAPGFSGTPGTYQGGTENLENDFFRLSYARK